MREVRTNTEVALVNAQRIFTDCSEYSEKDVIGCYRLFSSLIQIDSRLKEENFQIKDIRTALSQLSKRDYEIFYLRYFKNQTYISIAEDVGISRTRIYAKRDKTLFKIISSLRKSVLTKCIEENRIPYNVSIAYLELSEKVYNALKRKGIETIDELLKLSYQELLEIRNVGKVAISEIESKLKISFPQRGSKMYLEVHRDEGIGRLELSLRVYNALKRAGIKTIEELMDLSYEELNQIRNMGKITVTEIETKLKEKFPDYVRKQGIEEHKIEDVDGISIKGLGLSLRVQNILTRARVETIEELMDLSYEELNQIRNIGKITITEIEAKLQEIFPDYVRKKGIEGYSAQELEKRSIKWLGLSKRVYNLLTWAGIESIDKLLYLSYEELLQIPNIGNGYIKEIQEKLKELYPTYKMQDKKAIPDDYNKQAWNNVPITKLTLSNRTCNVLKRHGIDTVDKLLIFPKDDLIKIRNLGKASMVEVETELKKFADSV